MNAPLLQPAPVVSTEVVLPEPPAAAPTQDPAAADPEAPALDHAADDELGALQYEKIRKSTRKRLRNTIVTAYVLLGMTGGSVGWFVQSPARVGALTSSIQEIRSVGDVKAIVAKCRKSLDKVSVRSQQLDQATGAMGVTKSAEDEKDPSMDAEMKELMGGEGKTVGDRNRALQASFGTKAQEAGGLPKVAVVTPSEDSFDFSN